MNLPKNQIAGRLGKHRSTIYRELASNSGPRGYIHEEAQQRTDTVAG
jgi:IS30 family transposase